MAHSREEVETILTTDVRVALERFQSANSALKDRSSAGSVGVYRLEQAKVRAAADLRTALRRHSRFILDREVPADLREDLLNRATVAQAGAAD